MIKTKSGFTIVELLIVIVVIAILAAISVVAYNGIQQRSRNQQTVSAVAQYAKAYHLYVVDNGAYPPVRNPWSCIGIDYTCDGIIDSSTSTQALLGDLSSYMKSPPQPATATRVSSSNRTGGLVAGTVANPYILFIQEGRSTCPEISGMKTYQAPEPVGSDVVCRMSFTAL